MIKRYDVMIDIESLGLVAGDAILKIAVLEFSFTDSPVHRGDTLELTIDLNSSVKEGFKIDPDTLRWWLITNADQLKGLVTEEAITAEESMEVLVDWFYKRTPRYVWANSPAMDLAMIKGYCKTLGWDAPWQYTQERDVRTIAGLAPEIKEAEKIVGAEHDPVYDAIYQINYLRAINKKLNLGL